MPDVSNRSLLRLVFNRETKSKPDSDCPFQHVSASDFLVSESVAAHLGTGYKGSGVQYESRRAISTLALALGDTIGLSLAFFLAGFVRSIVYGPPDPQRWTDLILPMWFIGAAVLRLYPGWGLGAVEELRRQILTLVSVFGISSVLLFWSQSAQETSRFTFTLSFVLSLMLIPAIRRIVKTLLSKKGMYGLPVVVYGAGKTGNEVVRTLRSETGLGYIPIAYLDDHPAYWGERIDGIPVLGDTNLVLPEAQAAILAMPGEETDFQMSLLDGPLSYYRHVIIIPSLSNVPSLWIRTFDLGGMLGLSLTCNLSDPISRIVKRAFDIFTVLLFAPLIIPVCIGVAGLIWLSDRSNPIFKQSRLGYRGQTFNLYKFRTMVPNADAVLRERLENDDELRKEWEIDFKLKNDPRITPLGSFLRRTSLDEIPQLLNVLKGDMSLVGPRPLTGYHSDIISEGLQKLRNRVRPGISGLWQVSGRSDIGTAGMERFDSYYIRNWSIWLDIVVLVRTFNAVVRSSGAY